MKTTARVILGVGLFVVMQAGVSVRADDDRKGEAVNEPRSFDMILGGVNGNPPPPGADLALRRMIGQFVTDLDVKKLIQYAEPEGGGFHFCVEPVEPNGYDHIIYKLNTISPGSSSRWDVTLVQSCDEP